MLISLQLCTMRRGTVGKGVILVNPAYVSQIQPATDPQNAHFVQVGDSEDSTYWVTEIEELIAACMEVGNERLQD